MKHRFNYEWTLADAKFTKDKGTVFSFYLLLDKNLWNKEITGI